VFRPRGERYNEEHVLFKVSSGRTSVTTWGWMSADGLGMLWRIEGNLNSEQYVHILENIMLPSVRERYPEGRIVFQHDRSPIHTSRRTRAWFEEHADEVVELYWPGKGFDISPIEPVWAKQQQRLLKRRQIFRNRDDLYQAVLDEWEIIAEDVAYARNLVESVPRRLQAVAAAHGGVTKY